MVGQEAKRNQLMKSLEEHRWVKAALVVDKAGKLQARVGAAKSLKNVAGGTDQMIAGGAGGALAKENIYLVGAGEHFLIAIFDDGVEFDTIKRDVDRLLADLEL